MSLVSIGTSFIASNPEFCTPSKKPPSPQDSTALSVTDWYIITTDGLKIRCCYWPLLVLCLLQTVSEHLNPKNPALHLKIQLCSQRLYWHLIITSSLRILRYLWWLLVHDWLQTIWHLSHSKKLLLTWRYNTHFNVPAYFQRLHWFFIIISSLKIHRRSQRLFPISFVTRSLGIYWWFQWPCRSFMITTSLRNHQQSPRLLVFHHLQAIWWFLCVFNDYWHFQWWPGIRRSFDVFNNCWYHNAYQQFENHLSLDGSLPFESSFAWVFTSTFNMHWKTLKLFSTFHAFLLCEISGALHSHKYHY